MPLRNRVTPFGEIVALPGRGLMMGNRGGALHDEHQHVTKSWANRRWITCVLEFRGRRRKVMTPNRYTELFFLDEAASFAAGHRPCAECRNADYKRYQRLWRETFDTVVGANAMDLQLHADRLEGKRQKTYTAEVESLPDGTYVKLDGKAWLLHGGRLHEWSDSGYISSIVIPRSGEIDVITPRSTVQIFSAGYHPEVHPSAQ